MASALNITFPGNLAQVESSTDLRRVPSTLIALGSLFLVSGLEGLFAYDPGSLAVDDGTDVVRPNDKLPLQAGRWIRQIDGLASGPAGPAGADANSYATLTEMRAAGVTGLTYNLAGPTGSSEGVTNGSFTYQTGNFTGRTDVVVLDAVPITTGALVRQGAVSVAYGVDSVDARLSNEAWVTDYIPKSVLASIRSGTVLDASAYVQAAIDDLAAKGGGTLYYPNIPLRMNVVTKHQVSHSGMGRGNTRLAPFLDAPVIRTPTDTFCNNWRVENLSIFGNAAFTNQDGIRLETTGSGNFIDTVRLSNLDIRNCGRWGVYARGTSSSGPFVQRLYIDECEIGSNWRNIALLGCVLETGIYHVSACIALDRAADSCSVLVGYDPANGGSLPGRVSIDGGSIFSNPGRRAIAVGAVECMAIRDSGVEFADPGIFLDEFSLIRNVTVDNVSFNFIDATTYGVHVKACKNLTVTGCTFSSNAPLQAAVFLDAGPANIPNPVVVHNMRTGNQVLQMVLDIQGFVGTLEGTSARVYRSIMALAGTSNLDNLLDPDNLLTTLVRGDSVVTILSGGGTLTVKHGTGNLRLAGGVDYVLTGLKTLTFMYAGGVWLEIGRS